MRNLKQAFRDERVEEIITKIMPYLIGIILIGSFAIILHYALEKNNLKTCMQWQAYQEYPNFKVSDSMAEYCSHYKIYFNP